MKLGEARRSLTALRAVWLLSRSYRDDDECQLLGRGICLLRSANFAESQVLNRQPRLDYACDSSGQYLHCYPALDVGGNLTPCMVEDALGNRIGYTELRGARLPAQMLRFIIAKGQCPSNDSAGRGAAFALPNILL